MIDPSTMQMNVVRFLILPVMRGLIAFICSIQYKQNWSNLLLAIKHHSNQAFILIIMKPKYYFFLGPSTFSRLEFTRPWHIIFNTEFIRQIILLTAAFVSWSGSVINNITVNQIFTIEVIYTKKYYIYILSTLGLIEQDVLRRYVCPRKYVYACMHKQK